jgi:ArsR family transcriptional regulator
MTDSTDTKKMSKLTQDQLARQLSLAGDPTRLQILSVMFDWGESCVSTVADELDISVAAASYHLNLMADNGYFTRHRDGQRICYRLEDNEFISCLRILVEKNL